MPPPVLPPAGIYNPFKDAKRAIDPAYTPGGSQPGVMDWLHSIISGSPMVTGSPIPAGTPGSGRGMEKGNPVDAYNDNSGKSFPWQDVIVYGIAILFVVFGLKGVFK